MALPTNSTPPQDKPDERVAAQQDMLLREVDDAVRQDQAADFARRFGKPLLGVLVLGLAAFGGYLWWSGEQEKARETNSEVLIAALDQLEAGNRDSAVAELAKLDGGNSAGAAAAAALFKASLALDDGKAKDASEQFAAIAADADMPQPYRDLAAIRSVASNFDAMEPQQVVDRLKPLAKPGNPWFGAAAELVAMAYLKQGKDDLAGPLFAEIAKDEKAPRTLRSRARQMAGVLGVDAVEDVDKTLEELRRAEAADAAVQ